jgi:hypothetical protein
MEIQRQRIKNLLANFMDLYEENSQKPKSSVLPKETNSVTNQITDSIETSTFWQDNIFSDTLPSKYMEPEVSLPCSQESAISPYIESDHSSPHLHPSSLRSILILSSNLR